jgi:peroxiredoxin
MWRWITALVFIFLFYSCREERGKEPVSPSELSSVALKSLDGNSVQLKSLLNGHRATAFYFLMPGCPMCESYTRSINELSEKFSSPEISFVAVFSSLDYTNEEIIAFRENYNLTIPFYRDSDFKLTRSLGAKVTPEVFVLDSTAAVLYSGSIDNWAYATGKKRMEATEFFLNDALESIVAGKPVAVKSTPAYGCLIE